MKISKSQLWMHELKNSYNIAVIPYGIFHKKNRKSVVFYLFPCQIKTNCNILLPASSNDHCPILLTCHKNKTIKEIQREMTFTFIFKKVILRIPLTAAKTSSTPLRCAYYHEFQVSRSSSKCWIKINNNKFSSCTKRKLHNDCC